MVLVPTDREPTHPGEMLLEEFLKPLGLSQRDLADSIHVPYQRVNELVNQRRGITPSTALRLARYFGNSAGFWMSLQHRWDLYRTLRSEAPELNAIRPLQMDGQATLLEKAGERDIAAGAGSGLDDVLREADALLDGGNWPKTGRS